jgi:hypothetical protein
MDNFYFIIGGISGGIVAYFDVIQNVALALNK